MRSLNIKILASLILLSFVMACDKVEGPYIEGNPYSGNYDSDLPIRKILLEDFTGFGCVNCPRANDEIIKLQERYGNHLIPIAVHAGWFATPFAADDPDYRTDIGKELGGEGLPPYGMFNIQSQPIGVINRNHNEEDDYRIEYETWSSKIVEILSMNKFADIDIDIENSYNSTNRELTSQIIATAINEVNAKLSLSLYIIENKVIGKQRDGSEVIEDYEHNHMLRDGINGTWGDEISSIIPFKIGEKIVKSYNYILSDTWSPDNCEIVAFLYNTETLEVIQAEIAPVINEK